MRTQVAVLVTFGLIVTTSGNGDSAEPFVYSLNAKTKIMTFFTPNAEEVSVLDYTNNMSALYNGKTGAAFLVSYELGSAMYIPANSSNKTWHSSQQTQQDYLTSLSLLNLLELSKDVGIPFDSSSITGEISEEMVQILSPLSNDYSSTCIALDTYLHISKLSSDVLKNSLDGFTDVMGTVKAESRGDLKFLFGIFQGMGGLFSDVKCGIGLLNDEGVLLDLGKILTEPTGIHVLIYFLKQLPPTFNVGKHLGNILNNNSRFFATVDQMGGDLTYGFDGFINVLSEIMSLFNGQRSLQSILTVLNEFYNNPKTDIAAVREEWPAAVTDLQDAVKDLHLTEILDGLVNLLTSIQNGTWKENGVDMSLVIKALLEIDVNGDIDAIAAAMKLLEEYQP